MAKACGGGSRNTPGKGPDERPSAQLISSVPAWGAKRRRDEHREKVFDMPFRIGPTWLSNQLGSKEGISVDNIGKRFLPCAVFSAPGFEDFMRATSIREGEKNVPRTEAENEAADKARLSQWDKEPRLVPGQTGQNARIDRF